MSVTTAHEGDIAVITMEDGKANAMSTGFLEALGSALDAVEHSDARAVALLGREDFFSVGIDLTAWMGLDHPGKVHFSRLLVDVLMRTYAFPRPVVAGVTGHALAGGALLALAADERIIADGEFQFGATEVALGIRMPPFGIVIGQGALRPREQIALILHGETWDPWQLQQRGVVRAVEVAGRVRDDVLERAGELAELPAAAYAGTKELMRGPAARQARAEFHERVESFIPEVDAVAEARAAAKKK